MKNYLMNTYNRKQVSFVKGKGVYLWDEHDNKYLDALCGLAVTSLGHSHPEISKAVQTPQLDFLAASSVVFQYSAISFQ